MKKFFFSIALISVLFVSGCASANILNRVTVTNKDQVNQITASLTGEVNDNLSDLFLYARGAIAKKALEKGLPGFHIIKEYADSHKSSNYTQDPNGNQILSYVDLYTVYIIAALDEEPQPDNKGYYDAMST